ncbi:MAG: hypothetical protein E7182_01720 [Erysipelotrichaceae bacterium]|nr:hypothetical protein [Erysipelotrichaceae bacterium]
MDEFLHFMQGEMTVPGLFSPFHLVAIALTLTGAFLLPFFLRDASERVYKRILLIAWIALIVLEIGKQILLAFHYGSPSYWEYSYRDFPFSICSMVYYFAPIVLFVNKERHPKIVDAAIGYLCLVSLAGGLTVIAYPVMVTSRLIYINVQSFIHHGTQVILGVFVYVWNRRSVTIKTYYRSMIAFAITAAVAVVINVSFQPHFINMFFINPLIITNLPIGNVVQEKAGYPVFLIGFLSLIALVAFLIYLAETSIDKAIVKKKASRP